MNSDYRVIHVFEPVDTHKNSEQEFSEMGEESSGANSSRCQHFCETYRSKFPEVEYISSDELVQIDGTSKHDDVILVDVRTEEERRVSILEGSISKEDFVKHKLASISPKTQIITYCTIGYRSGLEARRLELLHPSLLRGKVKSLDGIVSYTHSLEKQQNKLADDEGSSNTNSRVRKLVDPETGVESKTVHTFGSMWACAPESYDAIYFSLPALFCSFIQVSGSLLSFYYLRVSTCFRKAEMDKSD